MLGGDALVMWQFHIVRLQAERLNGFDQVLAAVLSVHASLLTFHDRLDTIANDEDAGRLATEAEILNRAILADTQHATRVLEQLPAGDHLDPMVLPTLQVVQRTLVSQLGEMATLAALGDWPAVRLRLANQVHPLEFLTSALVERVDHEAGEEQARVALNITRVQRRVFLVVPMTAIFTLLIAGALGLGITRSITRPLSRLVEGSRMLARGDFQHQVSVPGDDELAHLGRVFNETARQLRELYASLQESEDRLRRVIDTIPAHVWSTLPDGSVDFINERLSQSTGASAQELLGSGWHSIVHPDDLTRYTSEWRAGLAAGQPTESEVRVLTADQHYRWMLVRNVPLRDSQWKIVKWYGTGIDIEDRKRAADQLRRSEAYLAEAQRLSRTGSFGWQVSTGEHFWSQQTYHILEYDSPAKPSLELFLDRTHPDDKSRVQQVFEQISRDGTGSDTEYRLLMQHGVVKYLHVVAHGIRDSAGMLEFIGAVTDVTPAKHAEEALRKAQADLAHVNRVTTMGELSASLAHELNQPIAAAAINAYTCQRWLKRDQPDVNRAHEAASRVVGDVNRAGEIISSLRLFFRKGAASKAPVDLNELIREMTVLLRNEALRHSIAVQTQLAEDLPLVVGDRVQLQQVLMNLMVNGIDAMRNVDGTRQLTLHSQQDGNEHLLISVEDTGVGLPSEEVDQIFNAFFTTKSHGTGMGLKISRTIVESHGGRLWAADNYPRGASFHFTLASQANASEDNGARSHQDN
jgi:PAS domain S-box-containing protein